MLKIEHSASEKLLSLPQGEISDHKLRRKPKPITPITEPVELWLVQPAGSGEVKHEVFTVNPEEPEPHS